MDVADQLQKLQQLHQSGAISDEEYAKAKDNLLNSPPEGRADVPVSPATTEQQTRQWAMFLHLSQLAGFLVPLAGLIAPILIWQIKKEELPGIDGHGKIVINWLLSAVLYAIALGFLLLIVFGVAAIIRPFAILSLPLVMALSMIGIASVAFAIVGGIKASNGEVWKYPLSIPFFK